VYLVQCSVTRVGLESSSASRLVVRQGTAAVGTVAQRVAVALVADRVVSVRVAHTLTLIIGQLATLTAGEREGEGALHATLSLSVDPLLLLYCEQEVESSLARALVGEPERKDAPPPLSPLLCCLVLCQHWHTFGDAASLSLSTAFNLQCATEAVREAGAGAITVDARDGTSSLAAALVLGAVSANKLMGVGQAVHGEMEGGPALLVLIEAIQEEDGDPATSSWCHFVTAVARVHPASRHLVDIFTTVLEPSSLTAHTLIALCSLATVLPQVCGRQHLTVGMTTSCWLSPDEPVHPFLTSAHRAWCAAALVLLAVAPDLTIAPLVTRDEETAELIVMSAAARLAHLAVLASSGSDHASSLSYFDTTMTSLPPTLATSLPSICTEHADHSHILTDYLATMRLGLALSLSPSPRQAHALMASLRPFATRFQPHMTEQVVRLALALCRHYVGCCGGGWLEDEMCDGEERSGPATVERDDTWSLFDCLDEVVDMVVTAFETCPRDSDSVADLLCLGVRVEATRLASVLLRSPALSHQSVVRLLPAVSDSLALAQALSDPVLGGRAILAQAVALVGAARGDDEALKEAVQSLRATLPPTLRTALLSPSLALRFAALRACMFMADEGIDPTTGCERGPGAVATRELAGEPVRPVDREKDRLSAALSAALTAAAAAACAVRQPSLTWQPPPALEVGSSLAASLSLHLARRDRRGATVALQSCFTLLARSRANDSLLLQVGERVRRAAESEEAWESVGAGDDDDDNGNNNNNNNNVDRWLIRRTVYDLTLSHLPPRTPAAGIVLARLLALQPPPHDVDGGGGAGDERVTHLLSLLTPTGCVNDSRVAAEAGRVLRKVMLPLLVAKEGVDGGGGAACQSLLLSLLGALSRTAGSAAETHPFLVRELLWTIQCTLTAQATLGCLATGAHWVVECLTTLGQVRPVATSVLCQSVVLLALVVADARSQGHAKLASLYGALVDSLTRGPLAAQPPPGIVCLCFAAFYARVPLSQESRDVFRTTVSALPPAVRSLLSLVFEALTGEVASGGGDRPAAQ